MIFHAAKVHAGTFVNVYFLDLCRQQFVIYTRSTEHALLKVPNTLRTYYNYFCYFEAGCSKAGMLITLLNCAAQTQLALGRYAPDMAAIVLNHI